MSTNKPTTRCSSCRKKLGLMPFLCRCELQFCSAHYHAEEHNCTYNYKKAAALPLVAVVADKMGTERL